MEKLNLSPIETDNNNEIERAFLGTTKDGAKVFNRADDSTHLHSEGGLTPELMQSALSAIDSRGRDFVKDCVRFDRIIGTQTCVDTTPEDDIVMVVRGGRGLPTPMVKNREPKPSDSIVVIMKKDTATGVGDSYELRTAYIGSFSPREPWDPSIESREEQKKCQDFWNTHALLYDENNPIINKEATEKFNSLSNEEKKLEYLKTEVTFSGLFVDREGLYGTIEPKLEKSIEHPHVTVNFKPEIEQLHLDQLGSSVTITAIGYGNDGKNEGLLVRIESDDPVVQSACDEIEVPHITLSISRGAHAKDTANLTFAPLDTPFELTGKYGLFRQGEVIEDKTELNL